MSIYNNGWLFCKNHSNVSGLKIPEKEQTKQTENGNFVQKKKKDTLIEANSIKFQVFYILNWRGK